MPQRGKISSSAVPEGCVRISGDRPIRGSPADPNPAAAGSARRPAASGRHQAGTLQASRNGPAAILTRVKPGGASVPAGRPARLVLPLFRGPPARFRHLQEKQVPECAAIENPRRPGSMSGPQVSRRRHRLTPQANCGEPERGGAKRTGRTGSSLAPPDSAEHFNNGILRRKHAAPRHEASWS